MEGAYEGEESQEQAGGILSWEGLRQFFLGRAGKPLGAIGEGVIQEAQRGRAVIPAFERLSPGLLPLGQTGWDVQGVPCIPPHLQPPPP